MLNRYVYFIIYFCELGIEDNDDFFIPFLNDKSIYKNFFGLAFVQNLFKLDIDYF